MGNEYAVVAQMLERHDMQYIPKTDDRSADNSAIRNITTYMQAQLNTFVHVCLILWRVQRHNFYGK